MDILQKIKKHKEDEVSQRRSMYPLQLLEESIYYDSSVVSLSQYIRRKDKSGVIAEFKKKSPSEGYINQYADVEEISIGYMQAGASALSILTDENFFGGSSDDLKLARTYNYCPILRKDFIVDEYQIHETKSIGADAILLIAEILSASQIKQYVTVAHQLGLEVLMEIHSEEELGKFTEGIDVIGVNNRNLKNFAVDIQHSIDMIEKLPTDVVKISESGIRDVSDMVRLAKAGYEGFLIGTQFMKTSHPAQACRIMLEDYMNQLSAQ